jgi:hypothetical protein
VTFSDDKVVVVVGVVSVVPDVVVDAAVALGDVLGDMCVWFVSHLSALQSNYSSGCSVKHILHKAYLK